ncbi:MAG: single-stranded DNA-binding protein [Bacteroidota bacterium]
MSGINKVILIGNLGKDPEVRYLEGGIAVAKLVLATNESFKNKDGAKVDRTEWHNINFWRGNAEFAEKFLKKGMQIYVEGKLRTRSYMDKDNIKRFVTDIEGDVLQILGKREDGHHDVSDHFKAADPSLPAVEEGSATDDLPF